MVKIIAGMGRMLQLKAPAKGTRPTTDRTKEALFSALEARGAICEANVLDLYAGTGALAIEALSRGAKRATLVDNSPQALACLKHNAKQAAHLGKILIVPCSTHDFLLRNQREIDQVENPTTCLFDLVFIDPPYQVDNETLEAELQLVANQTDPEGWIIVERSSRTPTPDFETAGLKLHLTKNYGETVVYFTYPLVGDEPVG